MSAQPQRVHRGIHGDSAHAIGTDQPVMNGEVRLRIWEINHCFKCPVADVVPRFQREHVPR